MAGSLGCSLGRSRVGPGRRVRLRELVVSTGLDLDVVAWILDLKRPTVDRVMAEDAIARPPPDLGALVRAVRAARGAPPEARWDALVACLWGLVALETGASTGEEPGRAPALAPDELRGLMRGAMAIETAVAQARAALLERGAGAGQGGADAGAGHLAEMRAELARRVAAAHRPGDDAGLADGDAGAALGARLAGLVAHRRAPGPGDAAGGPP